MNDLVQDTAPTTVLIGMPSGSGSVPIQTVQSLLQLRKPVPCGFATVERQRVDKARNMIAMDALRGGFDYLLFVDDDNPIPPNTLELMLGDDRDIVSAPILTRSQPHVLCSFYSKEVDTSVGAVRLYYPITKFVDDGPMHKVDATGTGCVLIKRRVLEVLFDKYHDNIFEFGDIRFDKQIIDGKEYDRRTMSEDCEFSERAVDAGFEIWVDDRIRPLHLGGANAVQWQENPEKDL